MREKFRNYNSVVPRKAKRQGTTSLNARAPGQERPPIYLIKIWSQILKTVKTASQESSKCFLFPFSVASSHSQRSSDKAGLQRLWGESLTLGELTHSASTGDTVTGSLWLRKYRETGADRQTRALKTLPSSPRMIKLGSLQVGSSQSFQNVSQRNLQATPTFSNKPHPSFPPVLPSKGEGTASIEDGKTQAC